MRPPVLLLDSTLLSVPARPRTPATQVFHRGRRDALGLDGYRHVARSGGSDARRRTGCAWLPSPAGIGPWLQRAVADRLRLDGRLEHERAGFAPRPVPFSGWRLRSGSAQSSTRLAALTNALALVEWRQP